MPGLTESHLEEAALSWFKELGYSLLHGPDIAPGELLSERASYADVLLASRLRSALAKINPSLSAEVIDEAVRILTRIEYPHFTANNHRFHQFLVNGIEVEHQKDGRTVTDCVFLVDPVNLETNDWLVVNQFTVIENNHHRRPDMVVFINGLPLVVIELKNPADENTTIRDAFKQIETYKAEISSLFIYNEVNVISDGTEAKAGTISSNLERFMPWKTLDGINPAPAGLPQLEVLIKGMFNKQRFLDLIRHFVVFELHEKGNIKKMAGYHQYHAVQKAIESTVAAIKGDKRAGIVWHTQGSGKSLTMMFYAGKLVLHPTMANPTLLVLTDRNDLDDQLFGTFSACHELLRQAPVQAETRSHLRELLKVASGGVVFTTQTAGISLLSLMKPTGANMILWTGLPVIFGMPFQTPLLLDLRPPRLKNPTEAPPRSLEIMLMCMTSIRRLSMAQPSLFITKRGWLNSILKRKRNQILILSLKK
jgi:type I restriction enzyme R subunit